MAWEYTVEGHFTVRERRAYPWQCAADKSRMFELWPGDVLTKHPNGTVTKHNGLCMLNLQVPEADLVAVEEATQMVVSGLFEGASDAE